MFNFIFLFCYYQIIVKRELNKFLKNPKNIKNKGMRCIITKYNLLTHGKHSISLSSSLFLLENLCFLFFSKEGFLQLSCDVYVFKRLWVTAMFTFLQDFLTDFWSLINWKKVYNKVFLWYWANMKKKIPQKVSTVL